MGDVQVELRAVGAMSGAEAVEDVDRQAARIGGGLEHQRRHGVEEHGLGDASLGASRAVAADVAGDLAAAGRVADVDRVLQIERLDQRHQVVGIGVHVVAVPRLGRSAVAAAVVGDAAKPVLAEVLHLRIPIIRAQRPAVAEHDRLSAAPVLVINRACRPAS